MPRQRKNQKSKAARVDSESDVEDIPRKTLLEQIEDRYPSLEPGVPFDIKKIKVPLAEALEQSSKDGVTFQEYDIPTGTVKRVKPGAGNNDTKRQLNAKAADAGEDEEDDVELGDMGQTFFYAVPMTMLLFGFYALVQKQYLEEPDYMEAFTRSYKSFLPIWFILYVTHPRRSWPLVQTCFFITAIFSGCWLVYNVNIHGYYAVMKMAPPLGTLLIFAVVEMELIPAFFSVLAIGGYVWYNDFQIM